MIPDIVIGDRVITWYTVMTLIGIFSSGLLIIRRGKKRNIVADDMIIMLLMVGIGVLVGSHLLYAITNYEIILFLMGNLSLINSFPTFISYTMFIFGGSVFYGGLIGGLIAGYIYCKIKKLDTQNYLICIVPYIPFFHMIARIGCFLSGCCYGIECSGCGVMYNHSIIAAANGVERLPIQLIESACNLFIFIVLINLAKNKTFEKHLLLIYLSLYAVVRFILEFFRGDELRGVYYGVSTSQIISIVILVVVIIRVIWLKKHSKALGEKTAL